MNLCPTSEVTMTNMLIYLILDIYNHYLFMNVCPTSEVTMTNILVYLILDIYKHY